MVFSLRGSVFEGIAEERDGVLVFKTFLAGEWVLGSDHLEVRSPIDLNVIARIPKLSWGDVDRALDRVYRVGRWSVRDPPGWKRLDILERIVDLLERYREDFVDVLVVNTGKTRPQAQGEVNASIDRLRRNSQKGVERL